MENFRNPGFIFIGIILLANSCAKVGPTGPNGLQGTQGPAGPAYTTCVIDGHVFLYDQYGTKILTGLSNVKLSLNGGGPIALGSSGYYWFSPLNSGYYNITATDSLFATTYINTFDLVLDSLTQDIKLSIIPTFNPTGISATKDSVTKVDSITITFPTDTRTRNCILFLNNTATVSNNISSYLATYIQPISGVANTLATITIPAQDLYDYGFTSGSWVYFAVYGYVVKDYSIYEDRPSGKNVYNAVSSTPLVDSAIVP